MSVISLSEYKNSAFVRACAVCVCVSVRAWVRACVRACVRVCVFVRYRA